MLLANFVYFRFFLTSFSLLVLVSNYSLSLLISSVWFPLFSTLLSYQITTRSVCLSLSIYLSISVVLCYYISLLVCIHNICLCSSISFIVVVLSLSLSNPVTKSYLNSNIIGSKGNIYPYHVCVCVRVSLPECVSEWLSPTRYEVHMYWFFELNVVWYPVRCDLLYLMAYFVYMYKSIRVRISWCTPAHLP